MSSQAEKKTRSLNDYEGLLSLLAKQGVPHVIIGGIAVGAYGRLMGETVLSADLDLYASAEGTRAILRHAIRDGAEVFRRPQPRSPQVTMFNWRQMEVNVLSATPGLASPEDELLRAREFQLDAAPHLPILVADPYDLLANKRAVHRPKDRPHIEVLRRFIEEEIVYAFERAEDPRERLAPARRYLAVTLARSLDEGLTQRLLPLVRTAPDARFLMNHVPTPAFAESLLSTASTPELREELTEIRRKRRFGKSR